MPQQPDALIEVTAFDWVPPFARGLVRDLRVRWALEELGIPYRTRLVSRFDSSGPVPNFAIADHPFNQVPGFADGDARLFESGAICLHLAERDDRLLPRDPTARAAALSWAFAALNSIEPFILHHQILSIFDRDKPGAADYAPVALERLRARLTLLADALGDRAWLADSFTVADILMVHVLAPPSVQAAGPPDNLAAYLARGKARPAYQAALAAQTEDFRADDKVPV